MLVLMKNFVCIWSLLHLKAISNWLYFSWILIIRIITLMLCLLMYYMIREQLQRDLACSYKVPEVSMATDYYTAKTVTCFLYLSPILVFHPTDGSFSNLTVS